MNFKIFKGTMIGWKELFDHTAERVAALPSELFVSISHSDDQGNGVVTLWYWDS